MDELAGVAVVLLILLGVVGLAAVLWPILP
jgi:hypothetical protein